MMVCLTPEISLPVELTHLNDRRKRSASENTESDISVDGVQNAVHGRVRRESRVATISSETYMFFIGFDLDGVVKYRNLSISLPEYAKLNVYADPQLTTFKEEYGNNVMTFKPYSPYNHLYIDISVRIYI